MIYNKILTLLQWISNNNPGCNPDIIRIIKNAAFDNFLPGFGVSETTGELVLNNSIVTIPNYEIEIQRFLDSRERFSGGGGGVSNNNNNNRVSSAAAAIQYNHDPPPLQNEMVVQTEIKSLPTSTKEKHLLNIKIQEFCITSKAIWGLTWFKTRLLLNSLNFVFILKICNDKTDIVTTPDGVITEIIGLQFTPGDFKLNVEILLKNIAFNDINAAKNSAMVRQIKMII